MKATNQEVGNKVIVQEVLDKEQVIYLNNETPSEEFLRDYSRRKSQVVDSTLHFICMEYPTDRELGAFIRSLFQKELC